MTCYCPQIAIEGLNKNATYEGAVGDVRFATIRYLYDTLTGIEGLSKEDIVNIITLIRCESAFNPNADNGSFFGLGQLDDISRNAIFRVNTNYEFDTASFANLKYRPVLFQDENGKDHYFTFDSGNAQIMSQWESLHEAHRVADERLEAHRKLHPNDQQLTAEQYKERKALDGALGAAANAVNKFRDKELLNHSKTYDFFNYKNAINMTISYYLFCKNVSTQKGEAVDGLAGLLNIYRNYNKGPYTSAALNAEDKKNMTNAYKEYANANSLWEFLDATSRLGLGLSRGENGLEIGDYMKHLGRVYGFDPNKYNSGVDGVKRLMMIADINDCLKNGKPEVAMQILDNWRKEMQLLTQLETPRACDPSCPCRDESPQPDAEAKVHEPPQSIYKYFLSMSGWTPPDNSPLILDMDGDGVESTGLSGSNVMFDHEGNGRQVTTGWVGSDDGFLVFDRNGDGAINDGTELFGDNTVKYDGDGKCKDGFEALAQEDTNGDGVISELDQNWASLKVWRDLNQDGLTNEGELFTMDELGITSLNVEYIQNNKKLPNGNYLYGTGSYTTSDGQTHDMADVFFQADPFSSNFTDKLDVPDDIKENIPYLNASGAVRSLWEACAQNENLKNLLTQYAAADTRDGQRVLLDALLLAWADTSGLYGSIQERAADRYDVINGLNEEWTNKLHILEAFVGRYFFTLPEDLKPGQSLQANISVSANSGIRKLSVGLHGDQIAGLNKSYAILSEYVYHGLLLQTRFADLLDMIEMRLDETTLDITLDFSTIYEYFTGRLSSDPVNGLSDLVDFTHALKTTLPDSGWIGYDLIRAIVTDWTATPELIDLYKDLHIYVQGLPGFNPNGTAHSDFIIGGDGSDRLYGGDGNDILDGGAGNDYLEGGSGYNTFVFGKGYGNDTINAYSLDPDRHNTVRLVGLLEEDVEFYANNLSTSVGSISKVGPLMLRIKETGEILTIQYGVSPNLSFAENPYAVHAIEFGDGRVVDFAEWAASGVPFGGTEADDVLLTGNISGIVHGRGGNDTIYGGSGNDKLYGGDGNDKLYGGDGNDILDGGAGNDWLYGGAGHNTFVFGKGYGNDTINAYSLDPDRHNTVRLVGLLEEDVEFYANNLSTSVGSISKVGPLMLRIKETGEILTIQYGVSPNLSFAENPYAIHAIEFGDGRVVDFAEWAASGVPFGGTEADDVLLTGNISGIVHGRGGNDTIYGGSGNDKLYGGDGSDRLYGGDGNDILDGGAGNDWLYGGAGHNTFTFVFGKGYGNDTINAYSLDPDRHNTVRLVGLLEEDVEFYANNLSTSVGSISKVGPLMLRIKETGEILTIQYGVSPNLSFAENPYAIHAIEFGDGRVVDFAEWAASGVPFGGTEADDVLLTGNISGIVHGRGGNDTLTGGVGNDTLYGDDGNDKLYGGDGNDILDGGAGNDYLEGGAGNDTYIFRAGGGQDSINNANGGNDLLRFENLNPTDLWFGRSSNNLTIGLVGTSDKVTVNNWYAGDYKIDTIQAGNDVITETQVAQLVQAMAAVGAPGGIDGGWTEDQKDALAPVLTTYWKAAA